MTTASVHTTGFIAFSPIEPERVIPLPRLDNESLVDVRLTLRATPRIAVPGTPPASVHDLRIYWSSYDITRHLLGQIRREIEEVGEARFRQLYERAMQRQIARLRVIHPILPDGAVERAEAQIPALRAAPLDALLAQYGDRTTGYNGDLHVVNFLFSEIPIDPLSLHTAVQEYAAATPGNRSPWSDDGAAVTISSGPSPSHAGGPLPSDFDSRGVVHYALIGIVEDPHVEAVRTLQVHVTEQLGELIEVLSAAGPVQAPLAVIRDDVHVIATRVSQANADIGDINNIRAVHESVQQIKRALGLP